MAFTMPTVDVDEFHAALTPSAPIGSDRFAGIEPITFVLPGGRAVSYRVHGADVTWALDEQDESGTIIEIDATSFGAFLAEYLTAPALQIQQRIGFVRGSFADFDRWEPLLRLLYTGRPLYDPDAVDRSALDRVFIWGVDPLEEIAAFHHEHGFAIVRGVFAASEAARLDEELDRLVDDADATDGDSWWVTSENGEDHVCQLHYTSLSSTTIASLEDDSRIRRLVECVDPGLVAHPEIGNGHFAVLKNPGVTGGLTDLAWHVDCGLGGHSILCPSLHIGIQVREMSPESGPMLFLAGSHRTSSSRPSPQQERSWPVVRVTAQPGDITLHSPDAMHAAPPPTGATDGRRTIYLSFGRPELSEVFGFKEGYDHIIFDNDGHAEFSG